jgi:membrane carboxypeptidase/penicillin-binding protein
LLLLLLVAALIHHVYFDSSALPDLAPFIRFEPPTTGMVYDAQGNVLIELAGEYRKVVSYDEVPVILRQPILAAEDKNFFSHSGVEYRALPRVIQKTVVRSLSEWWKGGGFRLRLPQGARRLRSVIVLPSFFCLLEACRPSAQ